MSTDRMVQAFLVALITIVQAGEFDLNWSTMDSGGVVSSSGGAFKHSGTIGQPDAGISSGADFKLCGGFWFPLDSGDCNGDGAVNLLDYGDFTVCVSGSGGGYNSPDCACFDLDGDIDVDLHDWGTFQTAFNDQGATQ